MLVILSICVLLQGTCCKIGVNQLKIIHSPALPCLAMAPTLRGSSRSSDNKSHVLSFTDSLRKVIRGGVSKTSSRKRGGKEDPGTGERLRELKRVAGTALSHAVNVGARIIQDSVSLLHTTHSVGKLISGRDKGPLTASLSVHFTRAHNSRISIGTSGMLSMSPLFSIDENANVRNYPNFEERRRRGNLGEEAFSTQQNNIPEVDTHVDGRTHDNRYSSTNTNFGNINFDSRFDSQGRGATLDPRPMRSSDYDDDNRTLTSPQPVTPFSKQLNQVKREHGLLVDTPRPSEPRRKVTLSRGPKREAGGVRKKMEPVVGCIEPATERTREKTTNARKQHGSLLQNRMKNGGGSVRKEPSVQIKEEPVANIKEEPGETKEQLWPLVKQESSRY